MEAQSQKMMPLSNAPAAAISMPRSSPSSSSSSSTGPPLSAIDRFLWGQLSHWSALWPNTISDDIEASFIDEFIAKNNEVVHQMMVPSVLKKQVPVLGKNRASGNSSMAAVKRMNKKGSSSSASLIKGQWTDEEDRKLVKLVNEYGVRKWAQIAENLEGRAGKQCRERWHNHLRPHIKVSFSLHQTFINALA